jgi:undecaprenyl pyrophosphate synthase
VEEEEEPQPTYPKREYVLEDFSQQAINRGQQEINYLVTVADNKIVEALKQVSTAVAKLAACGQVDLGALDQAINEVSEATRKIAGPFPPGCLGGVQNIAE